MKNSLRCPKCKGVETFILYSKQIGAKYTRRRRCKDCGFTFTTTEQIIGENARSYGAIMRRKRKANAGICGCKDQNTKSDIEN